MAAVAAIALVASPAHGAWTQAPGKGQVINRAGAFGTVDGIAGAPDGYVKIEATTYSAFGLFNGVTVGAAISNETDRDPATGATRSRVAEAAGFVRMRLWKDDWSVLSIQPRVGARFEANFTDPRWDAEMRVLAGRGFPLAGGHGFAVAEVAGRYRDATDGHQARLDLTLGWRPWPELMLLAQNFTTAGVGESALETKLQGSIVWDVSATWSLELGARGEWIPTARAGADLAGAAFLGVWRRF